MELKQEQLKPEDYDMPDNDDDDEQSEVKHKVSYDLQLLSAAKKGDYEWAEKCINKKANVSIEQPKKKWTPLVWASCKGYVNIVKLLLSKGAAIPYTVVDPANRLVTMGANKQVKPTPMQWACFKGNTEILLLLLKAGLHWEDVDCFGNNSVSLCVAGNCMEIFKIFLQYGVLLNVKNSRGHAVKELATSKQILDLIKDHEKATVCYSSKAAFKQNQIKQWCSICHQFFKTTNYRVEWVFKDAKSEERNEIDGRCLDCWSKLNQHTKQITKAMQSGDYKILTQKLTQKTQLKVKFEVKFMERALILQQKLRTQGQILQYIKTLAKVPNYKIILKAVDTLDSMLKDAHDRNVAVDNSVIQICKFQKERLIAERNLRFLLDNIDTATAKRQQVKNLQEIYNIAADKKVAPEYLQTANNLKVKMGKAILAQDIYQQFKEYPLRPDPYPEPLQIDFKTKKPLDPATKKVTDPANLIPKKNKKTPKFNVPEWATELKALNDKIKELEQLCKLKDDLNLTAQFVKQCHEIVALMKKESRYRKDMDDLQKMVDQANKKPPKK